MKTNTASIQRSILKALTSMGIYCDRLNSGSFKVNDRYVKGARKGTPDIFFFLAPTGRACYFELKRPGEKPKPHQLKWHEDAREHGCRVAVVTSLREAIDIATNWRVLEGGGR